MGGRAFLRACSVAMVAIFCLGSCGGGGGGSDKGGDSGFRVSFDASALNFAYQEGGTPVSRTVTATAHGTPPSSGIFVGAIVDGPGIQQPVTIDIDYSSSRAYVHVVPMAGLPAGVYQGTIRLLACADQTCNRHFSGSPHRVNYTITVGANIAVEPASVSFSAVERTSAAAQTLSVTLPTGVAAATTAVSYGAGASGWLHLANGGAEIVLTPNLSGLAAGSYSAELQLSVTGTDQRVVVPVSLAVAYDPALHLRTDKSSLVFAGPEAQELPPEAIEVSLPPGSAGITTSLVYGAGATNWLQVQKSGSTLVVTPSVVGLAAGTYTASVRISDSTTGERVDVPVTLTVAYDALLHLRVDQSSLAFTAVETEVMPVKVLGIGLPPSATGLGFSASYGAGASGWLGLQRVDEGLQLSVSTAGLAPGSYTASVNLAATGTSETLVVPVTLTIAKGLLPLADQSVVIDLEADGTGLFGVMTRDNVSTTTWSASSDKPWLVLETTTGSILTPVRWRLDPVHFESLANNADHVATVTVAGAGLSAVTQKITFTKQFREIDQIDTLALIEGESGELMLYGEGFAGIANFLDRLSVSSPGGDLLPVGVVIMSDRVASVRLQGGAAGNYTVTLRAAMGSASRRHTLRVLAPQTYPYQALETFGKKGQMIWDPVSQSAFVLDVEASGIHRFQWNGSAFVQSTLSTTLPRGLSMSRDQESLVLAMADGTLQFHDPGTLVFQRAMTVGGTVPELIARVPLAIMGDSRMWQATEQYEGSAWNYLTSLHLGTGNMQTIDDGAYSFYYGPWGAVSPDGRRMIMSQSAGISPAPLPLRLDLVTNQLETYPSGVPFTFFTSASSSRDGSRWIFDAWGLYNYSLDKLGDVVPPAGWRLMVRTGVVSDDGTRGYFYSYADDAISPYGDYESTTPAKPRIHVYDFSASLDAYGNYPLLGYIEIDDYSGCRASHPDVCDYLPRVVIARDGRTIFVVGDRKFVVVPVPADLQPGEATEAPSPISIMSFFRSATDPGRKMPEMRRWRPLAN